MELSYHRGEVMKVLLHGCNGRMGQTLRYGVARGLFSNEAGMGSTPHAH
ncbi:alanine:cation symporter family protein, partial [Thermobrachium celere]